MRIGLKAEPAVLRSKLKPKINKEQLKELIELSLSDKSK